MCTNICCRSYQLRAVFFFYASCLDKEHIYHTPTAQRSPNLVLSCIPKNVASKNTIFRLTGRARGSLAVRALERPSLSIGATERAGCGALPSRPSEPRMNTDRRSRRIGMLTCVCPRAAVTFSLQPSLFPHLGPVRAHLVLLLRDKVHLQSLLCSELLLHPHLEDGLFRPPSGFLGLLLASEFPRKLSFHLCPYFLLTQPLFGGLLLPFSGSASCFQGSSFRQPLFLDPQPFQSRFF